MERSNLCSKLKQGSITNSSNNRSMNYMRHKGSAPWDLCNEHGYWKEGDLAAAGFLWPPRSYTCTFCKREFRSAQALGGHMNVHRRDRARLRLSPTVAPNKTLNLDLNPTLNSKPSLNPNPSFSCPSHNNNAPPNLSSLFTKFPQFTSTLPPICRINANSMSREVKRLSSKGCFAVEKFGSSGVEKGCDHVFRKGGDQFVRLDLEIGLISQSEELDLELRLGYT